MLIPTCVIKFIELVDSALVTLRMLRVSMGDGIAYYQILAIACLTLHHYSYDLTDLPTLMLCSGTYVGYVVVLSGEIVGEMIFAPLDLVQDMYFGTVGVGLHSVCGGLVLAARTHDPSSPRTGDPTAATVAASLAIVNGLLMLFDLSLAYMDSEEYDDEASI